MVSESSGRRGTFFFRAEVSAGRSCRFEPIMTLMSERRKSNPRYLSLRDMPGAVAAYAIISAVCVGLGLLVEELPEFWRGVLFGGGLGLMGAYLLLAPKPRKIDVGTLPSPSGEVQAKIEDPNCTIVEAIKAYRDQTGVGLSEAKALVESHRSGEKTPGRGDTVA